MCFRRTARASGRKAGRQMGRACLCATAARVREAGSWAAKSTSLSGSRGGARTSGGELGREVGELVRIAQGRTVTEQRERGTQSRDATDRGSVAHGVDVEQR